MPLTYSIEKLQDEPIVIFKVFEAGQLQRSMPTTVTEATTLLDELSEPVFLVLDLSGIKVSLDTIISGANREVRVDRFITHPNVREVLDVATNPMMKMAATGLRSNVFGNIKIQVFDTVEEALEYARSAPEA